MRKVEAMAPFVKDLKDADIQALADHYEKLPAKPSEEKVDPALAERGAQIAAQRRCELVPSADARGAAADAAARETAHRLHDPRA